MEGSQHTRHLEEAAKNTKIELTNKATVADVHACVRRRHYDEAVTALGAAIDDKAPMLDLHSCESRVQVVLLSSSCM